MNVPNYNGDNMLVGAEILNNQIRKYIKSRNVDKNVLEEYKLDIEEYLRDIPPFHFAPREDDLTKEQVLIELKVNLYKIDMLLDPKKEHQFFNSFDMLMELNNALPDNYKRITPKEVEQLINIVNGIKESKREQLNNIPVLRKILQNAYEIMQDNLEDRRNWDYVYPSDVEGLKVSIYIVERIMEQIIMTLLKLLETPSQTFGIMTPSEQIGIESMKNQLKLPEDVVEHGIGEFLGKKTVGGKLKKKMRRTYKKKSHKKMKTKHRRTKRRNMRK